MTSRMLLVCVLATACHRPTETRGGEPTRPSAPIAAAEAITPADVAAPPIVNRCPDAIEVNAERLATAWTTLIGRRIRLQMRIERAVDFTLAVGASNGRRFAIVLSPDATWAGTATKTFTVIGSRAVRVGGRATLPELLLDTGDCDE